VEVREQDLVHPPPGLEGVQLVLARLGGDVARLVREQRARRMNALAARFEDARDGILGEPVDLEPRHERPQLADDRDVAPGVAEADRRRDDQRPLGPPHRAAPGRVAGRAAERPLGEVAHDEVEPHRVTCVGTVPDALELDELCARRVGERPAAVVRDEQILVALQHE
jgi:hypothetical protein